MDRPDRRRVDALRRVEESTLHEAIPDAFLEDPLVAGEFPSPAAARDRYRTWLSTRLDASDTFTQDAIDARTERQRMPPVRRTARR